MYFVILLGVDEHLSQGEQSGQESMIGEQEVIEIDLPCLILTYEIAVCAIDGVEREASDVHGHEVEVHTLDAR